VVDTEAAAEEAADPDVVALLRELDFLKDADPDTFQQVCRAAERDVAAPGELVCRKGEPGSSMFVVESGSFVVYGKDRERIFQFNQRGDYFGELCALHPEGERTATVEADDTNENLATFWRLDHRDLLPVLDKLAETTRARSATSSLSKSIHTLRHSGLSTHALRGSRQFTWGNLIYTGASSFGLPLLRLSLPRIGCGE
jgi:CRP-like cAMP-binding protein